MSCEACRQYHYKCDNAWPSCSRCAKVSRTCVRPGQFRFKNSALSSKFPRVPCLAKQPSKILFVGQSLEAEEEHRQNSPGSSSGDHQHSISRSSPRPPQPEAATVSSSSEPPPQSTDTACRLSWPVESEQEAFLLRHFVSTVSHFFDFADPKRHFARVVPQRARANGTLANAVFALSARHLSRTSTFNALFADVYYQRCLQQLIPALATNIQDESLLVAAVILRLMEEIDVPVTGSDLQNHLVGTQAIVRAQEQQSLKPGFTGGLLQAAHWAALRQDLYISFATQRPMLLSSLGFFRTLQHTQDSVPSTDTLTSDEEDMQWTNCAVLQCCDVAQFVFGSMGGDVEEFGRLRAANLRWKRCKPQSFEPFYVKESTTSRPIPDIRLLTDWHVMGHMYNLLTKILLETNKPASLADNIDDDANIRPAMCEMIGIALHNPNTPSAHLVASMAIAMCGRCLSTETEMSAMRQILADTERLHGWPTQAAQTAVKG